MCLNSFPNLICPRSKNIASWYIIIVNQFWFSNDLGIPFREVLILFKLNSKFMSIIFLTFRLFSLYFFFLLTFLFLILLWLKSQIFKIYNLSLMLRIVNHILHKLVANSNCWGVDHWMNSYMLSIIYFLIDNQLDFFIFIIDNAEKIDTSRFDSQCLEHLLLFSSSQISSTCLQVFSKQLKISICVMLSNN